MNSLTGLLGAPNRDESLTGPWLDETGCSGATGYGCVDYLRFVEWNGLLLVFTDGSPTVEGDPNDSSTEVTGLFAGEALGSC